MRVPTCDLCSRKMTIRTAVLQAPMGENYRDIAQWQWAHMTCGTEPLYWIAAHRISTMRKALAWTLHLSEKFDLLDSGWEAAIRRALPIGGTA